jgi:hypothetical protein
VVTLAKGLLLLLLLLLLAAVGIAEQGLQKASVGGNVVHVAKHVSCTQTHPQGTSV